MIRIARGVLIRWERLPGWGRWLVVAVWLAAIWWLSSRTPTGGSRPIWSVVCFNAGHIVLFGGLAGLISTAIDGPEPRRGAMSVLAAAIYGIIDEMHQSTVPGRDASGWDVCTDLCAAVLVVTCVAALRSGSRRSMRWAITAAIGCVISVIGASV